MSSIETARRPAAAKPARRPRPRNESAPGPAATDQARAGAPPRMAAAIAGARACSRSASMRPHVATAASRRKRPGPPAPAGGLARIGVLRTLRRAEETTMAHPVGERLRCEECGAEIQFVKACPCPEDAKAHVDRCCGKEMRSVGFEAQETAGSQQGG